jgi:hypothetical protein
MSAIGGKADIARTCLLMTPQNLMEARLCFMASWSNDFDLDSITLGKHILNRQDLE